MLYSCSYQSNSEKTEDPNKEKLELIDEKTGKIDTVTSICDKLTICLVELKYLTGIWVREQTKADDENKIKLLEKEKQIPVLDNKLKKINIEDISRNIDELSEASDSVLREIAAIKELLPDFAAYEDPSAVFLAHVTIETDSEFNLYFVKTEKNILFIQKWAEHERLMLEKEKNEILHQAVK